MSRIHRKLRAQLGSRNPSMLLVMEDDLLTALNAGLLWNLSFRCTSTTVQAARRKLVECSPHLVVTGITLADGTWCDIARTIGEIDNGVRLLVAEHRHGELLFGDVVRRGGYLALAPPHRWFSAAEVEYLAARSPDHGRSACL